MPRLSLLALASLLLAGCGNISNVQSFSTPYTAPAGAETARVRVYTNGMARGVPNHDCIDWRVPGAGVIAVARKGFANRNGQTLDMPASALSRATHDADWVGSEIQVPAGKPFVFHFLSLGTKEVGRGVQCGGGFTFTPQAGQSYDMVMLETASQCTFNLKQLSGAEEVKVPLTRVGLCSWTDNF